MLGRATPLWILGFVSMVSGLLCTVVILQFAQVLPWAGAEATYIGGPWTGGVTYAMAAALAFAAGYGWLTVKPWSSMVTIFAAGLGIFAPFISYMDDTDPRSSAILPVVTSVLMLALAFRSSTNRAMALALSGEKHGRGGKTPPPPKPMSAARKREVAAAQAQSPRQPVAGTPAVATAGAGNSMATAAVAAATNTAAQAIAAIPKPADTAPVRPVIANMAKSAASALGMASRSPAKPAPASKPVAPAQRPAAPAALPAGGTQRPRGFRADEV